MINDRANKNDLFLNLQTDVTTRYLLLCASATNSAFPHEVFGTFFGVKDLGLKIIYFSSISYFGKL